MSIYDFTVLDQNGQEVSLSEYKGKVLLIVNTATGCGFTPQYSELQEMYDKYHDQGLEILDFPCNQFGNQAPGSDDEIHDFCTGRFGITFPQFTKVDVKGETAIPLFRYLEENTTFDGFDGPMGMMLNQVLRRMDKEYAKSSSIKWNFTKFLIARDGTLKARFEPTANLKKVDDAIKELI